MSKLTDEQEKLKAEIIAEVQRISGGFAYTVRLMQEDGATKSPNYPRISREMREGKAKEIADLFQKAVDAHLIDLVNGDPWWHIFMLGASSVDANPEAFARLNLQLPNP